jgi:hypothetical protein
LSGLALRSERTTLIATLTLARVDAEALVALDANRDGRVSAEEFAKARPELELAGADALKLSLDGTNMEPSGIVALLGPGEEVCLQLAFPRREGARLRVQSALLENLPRGHRQYAVLRDGQDKLVAEKILDANHATLEATLAKD